MHVEYCFVLVFVKCAFTNQRQFNSIQRFFPLHGAACVCKANVLTGREGWFKRVDRDQSKVARKAVLTNQSIDPTGLANERLFNATKREVIAKHVTTTAAPTMGFQPMAAKHQSSKSDAWVWSGEEWVGMECELLCVI